MSNRTLIKKFRARTNNCNIYRWDLLAALLFGLCLALCIYKLPYGMASVDEAFYFTIPYRLFQGDGLLAHEWHLTQLSALIQLPFLGMYLSFTEDTEGIFLAFRGIYLFYHSLTVIYLYMRLRRISCTGALCAMLPFMIYAPFNISTLSYNSMGIDLLAVVFVTIAISQDNVWEKLLCGLCFAGAVLCNPYNFLLYLVYTAAVFFCTWSRRETYSCLSLRFWLGFTGSAAVLALILLLFVTAKSDISILRETIPAIIFGDTAEHPKRSLFGVFYGMWAAFHKNGLFVPTFLLSALLFSAIKLDRQREEHAYLYLSAAAILSIAYGLWFRLYFNVVMNFYMFPTCILGFFAWLLSDGRRNNIFFFIYLPGVLCWFCSSAASNLGFINISSVATINMLASSIFICDAIEQHINKGALRRLTTAVMLMAIVVPFAILLECKAIYRYPMRPISECTERVEHGTMRGLIVAPEDYTRYTAARAAAESVREYEGENVAYLTGMPDQYLEDTKKCGVFSAWFPGVSVQNNIPRLLQYWEIFPERVPERILLGFEDAQATELLRQFFAEDYAEQNLGGGFWLLERR